MAVKSVIDIDVKDDSFKEFMALFNKYKTSLDKLPGAWEKTDDAIHDAGKSSNFLTAAIISQTDLLRKQLNDHAKIRREIDNTNRSMTMLGRSSRKVFENIQGMTVSMLKWGGLSALATGVFGLLSGGTGFFGFNAMAQGVSASRQQAGLLGLDPGELKAVQTAYGRVSGASTALGGVAGMKRDVSRQFYLRQLGISQGDIEGKTSAELMPDVMLHLKDAIDALPENMIHARAEALGYTQFMSEADLQQLRKLNRNEVVAAGERLPSYTREFAVTQKTASAYDDFMEKMKAAGERLETTLVNGLVKLAGPLGNVVDSFTHLATKLFDDPAFVKGVEDFASGIESFAATLGSEKFQEQMVKFVNGITDVAKGLYEWSVWLFGDKKTMPGPVQPQFDEFGNIWNLPDLQRPMKFTPNGGGLFQPASYMSPLGTSAGGENLQFGNIEEAHNLPPGLLHKIMMIESGGNPFDVNPKSGAMGAFQFMPGTAKDFGLTNPFDVQQSADAAGRYFEYLMKIFNGDIEKAAAGYNWGQGNVQKAVERAAREHKDWVEYLPNETANYIRNVGTEFGGSHFAARSGQGVKISINNAAGGNYADVVASLAAPGVY